MDEERGRGREGEGGGGGERKKRERERERGERIVTHTHPRMILTAVLLLPSGLERFIRVCGLLNGIATRIYIVRAILHSRTWFWSHYTCKGNLWLAIHSHSLLETFQLLLNYIKL